MTLLTKLDLEQLVQLPQKAAFLDNGATCNYLQQREVHGHKFLCQRLQGWVGSMRRLLQGLGLVGVKETAMVD